MVAPNRNTAAQKNTTVDYFEHSAAEHIIMAPKAGTLPAGLVDPTKEKWVTTAWIPHTTLSQTSHVCLTIRSAHVVLDMLSYPVSENLPEWRVRIGVFGIAGLPLLPVQVHTTAASVLQRPSRQDDDDQSETTTGAPLRTMMVVSKATHDCQWDAFVHVPIRWRDLPRDAYLVFEILSHGDTVVYQTTMAFFSRYGKLKMGLQKLELSTSPPDPHRNHGLSPVGTNEKEDSNDDDPVWQAVLLLDELERMEERARTNLGATDTFGQIPSVPWLDKLEKERAKKIIAEAMQEKDVSDCSWLMTVAGSLNVPLRFDMLQLDFSLRSFFIIIGPFPTGRTKRFSYY